MKNGLFAPEEASLVEQQKCKNDAPHTAKACPQGPHTMNGATGNKSSRRQVAAVVVVASW
eukprot:366400-Chlamydomonas_euryale.AAC.20